MDAKSLARYKASLRRYNSNPVGKKQSKVITNNQGYDQAEYLGFDTSTGKHKFKNSSGKIVSTKSLSNNAVGKGSYGLYSQGFSVNPFD